METLTPTRVAVPSDQRVVLRNISWEMYEQLRDVRANWNLRMTYNQGVLEIMSPSRFHDLDKRLIGRMIETMTEEFNIPISSGGSTTYKSELLQKGLEPDECYYVANEPVMRGKRDLDPGAPPPDLAIEVEVTHGLMDKLEVYAALGVPELWRWNGRRVFVYRLQADGSYREQDRSDCFPFFPMSTVKDFIDKSRDIDETTWIRSFRQWVRENLTGGK